MKVKASPGLQCPMENKPKEYISDDDQGMEVPDSAYYRRLIDDGSLEEIKPASKKAKGGDQ